MIPNTALASLENVEFLVRSEHRVAVLDALAERPRTRADLRAHTGASASTISRTLRAFEERNWISRSGDRYEATPLGAFVATGLQNLLDRFATERQFRDIWRWLPSAERGFAVEMVRDAVVTVADVDAPYRPVNRFASLLRSTTRFRFVGPDVGLLEPCGDDLRRRILDGMEAEIIDPPSAARYVGSTYRDHCAEPLESGNLTVRLHDDVPPYGMSIFDDRIAISCCDRTTGTVRVLVDTDSAAAREWAESTFEACRQEARPLALEPTAG